ncbi:hypothetical protein KEJ28_03855 [Candidatus Bathyarchaeota archaeon]|nr:hypothetical protein [Candidatus Bathyarchaeota archaeon]
MSGDYGFIMMIRDKWWIRFCYFAHEGRRIHSYVSGPRAAPKWAFMLLFYVPKPVRELRGYAEFIERKVGDPEELWIKHGCETVFSSKEDYFRFIRGWRKVSFIRFKNFREAVNPMPFTNLCLLLGVKRLARRGFYIDREMVDKIVAMLE